MLSRPPATRPDIDSSRRGMAIMLITHLRNPCKAARALYLNPPQAPHSTLSGPTAEAIAESLGVDMVESSYYYTKKRWLEHRRGLGLPELPLPEPGGSSGSETPANLDLMPRGTVGAVCLDQHGCIVAVTSTGGRTNKLPGRLGEWTTFTPGATSASLTPARTSRRYTDLGRWLLGRRMDPSWLAHS